MSKLRELADVHYGKSPNEVTSIDGPYPVFGTGGIYGLASRPLFQGPAVVVPRKGSLGNPHFVGSPFWASDTTYAVVPKPKVDAKWLYYSLDAFDLTKLNEATGVPSINRDWLYRINLGSQEFGQQRRIAEILTTVDEAMEQTEALVGKLEQMKAGLMHDLFTRGVTPDGHLRPTRQEAPHLYHPTPLGWIPKEWAIQRLKTVADVTVGYVGPTNPFYTTQDRGVLFLRTGNIVNEGISLNDVRWVTPEFHLSQPKSALKAGDVVVSRVGYTGTAAVIPELGQVNCANMIVIRRTDALSSEWIRRLFGVSIYASQVAGFTAGSAQPVLNIQLVERLLTPIPPSEEQLRITDRIAALDDGIEDERAILSKLRQQKQGLMQDLLTGRVRVDSSKESSP